ncbi:VanZ family protein [Corynebacterium flavescens]|uniref:VanZ family protein n=1 Tax=Corynebacterium flavescens TaxID=28028 RepID=UPI003FD27EE9
MLARGALVAWIAVMIALTTLKPFYRIGYLWVPEKQRVRQLELVPLDEFSSGSWFAPLFEYAGNTAFFLPFGLLVFGLTQSVHKTVAAGFALSAVLEAAQYALALGRSDIDDLLFNTLGALLGAVLARWAGPRWQRIWQWLSLGAAAVFAVLVILGPRLGDPDQVKELSVGHVDELGVVQLVGHLNGVDRAAAVLG